MPELPEVENITRGLKELVIGKTITNVDLLYAGVVKNIDAESFVSAVHGKKIQDIKRQGKFILFYFSEDVMEVHLRMTGTFLFFPDSVKPGPYARAIFTFRGDEELHFQDIRKFGTFRLWEKKLLEQSPAFSLGPDPLDDDFCYLQFKKILEQKPKSQLKSFLLNQKNIAGLGNIYVDEALHEAKIHPARKIVSLDNNDKKVLFESIVSIINQSIKYRGTSFSDYRDLQGQSGTFQKHLKVYKKENTPCFHCGHLLQRIKIAGRGTYFCACCQRSGRPLSDRF